VTFSKRNYIVTNIASDYTDLKKKADLVMVGPITKNFYALDKGSGKLSGRDWSTSTWSEVNEVKGGAIDLWVMPEPNKTGPAGERVAVLAKNGSVLESWLFPTNTVVKTTFQGNTSKISQFRSIEIGGSLRYICLGEKGKLYSGQPVDSRLPAGWQFTEWVDLGDGIKGISIGKDERLSANLIIAYSEKKLLRRRVGAGEPFQYPKDQLTAWTPMGLPPSAKGKKITFAAASQSGHTLVCLDTKLWVFMPLSQDSAGSWNWGWTAETKGDMKAVFEEPIRASTSFANSGRRRQPRNK